MIQSKFSLKSILLVVILSGCASLQEMAEKTLEKPKLSVASATVQKLSFKDITLLFNINIENPNVFGLNLAGLTYDFKLNDTIFLQGEKNTELSIPADGSTVIRLPLTLNYANAYKAIRSLNYSDKTNYALDLELAFNIPVIGFRAFPLSHSGEFPLPKLPSIKIDSIRLERLTVAKADLSLNLKIKNPNIFAFAINKMDYNLIVDGRNWLSGLSEVKTNVSAKKESIVSFPISLNFFEVGRTVFKLLNSGEQLDYQLKGGFKIAPAFPLFKEIEIPFDQVGKIPLSK